MDKGPGDVYRSSRCTGDVKGIWRIPVDEIDRPGSFASHMNRSIVLLLNVLSQLKDYGTLLKVSSMLQRTPDQGKTGIHLVTLDSHSVTLLILLDLSLTFSAVLFQSLCHSRRALFVPVGKPFDLLLDDSRKYLRDADRQVLAQRAFVLTVTVLEDMLNEFTEVSEDQDSEHCSLLGGRMTTDVSNKTSSEEGHESLPKKTALPDGGVAACGAENGIKEVTQGQPLTAMDTVEQENKGDKEMKETSRPGSTEPMDFDGYSNDPEKMDSSFKCTESARMIAGRISKDKTSETRTPELSLEDLSISSKHQQQEAVKVRMPAVPAEEVIQRPSRKRKLATDAESGKTLLLDAYRVWQQGQKVMSYDLGKIEKIMSKTYMLIKQVDEEAALEQAVKFCQVHIGASAQKQSTGETPTTPKPTKDSRESFFPVAPISLSLPSSVNPDCLTSENFLRLTDLPLKPKTASPSSSAAVLLPPQAQMVAESIEKAPAVPCLALEEEEGKMDRPLEGLGFQQQESCLCQQMKMATVASSSHPAHWQVTLESATSASSGQVCSQASGSKTDPQLLESQQSKVDSSRAKSRILANMPKLFIPSSITKFPPEITVTPPTPTLLSPKGSISEETKQKLKSAILSAQSAANVKKESLCQPALEIVETSSQESSLESDTDEEDDYMDV
uniref:Uncharacterized protein n=1 Tax=Sphaerodactylus townsendi TaxID=933632 RepID=A0ACB8FXW1_9SAUR